MSIPTKATDKQIGGNHYKDMPIQPIEFIMKNKIGFCEANVIEYVCRHKHKNGIEDLKKARHYIDLLIQFDYEEEDTPKVEIRVTDGIQCVHKRAR